MHKNIYLYAMALFLAGCSSLQPTPDPVIDQAAAMEYLERGLRPEVVLFPQYLMMEGFELSQHGRIPEGQLVGAGLKTRLSLSITRRRFMDQLDSHGWEMTKMEIEAQSFRIIAENKMEHIEIRAVQGIGPTEIFMLYRPDPAADPETF